MKVLAAIVLIAACSHDDDPRPPPAPAPIDAPVRAPTRARLASGTWRVPILTITPHAVALRWRSSGQPDEVAVDQPLARWSCTPLHAALIDEAKRTWGRTPVRPPDSEELLVSVDPAVPDATAFAITKCVNDPSDPRPPYRDVMIVPDSSQ